MIDLINFLILFEEEEEFSIFFKRILQDNLLVITNTLDKIQEKLIRKLMVSYYS